MQFNQWLNLTYDTSFRSCVKAKLCNCVRSTVPRGK